MTRTEELLKLCDAEDTADIDIPCGWLKQLVALYRLQNEALKFASDFIPSACCKVDSSD